MRVVPIPPGAGEVFVAKQCAHCGKILPSDTTRYCPGCMNRVPSSRPVNSSLSVEPPDWMKKLESSLTNTRSNVPLRELRAKVWEQEQTKGLTLLENDGDPLEEEQHVVDDSPTRPLPAAGPTNIDRHPLTKSNHTGEHVDDVEIVDDSPTLPLVASLPETPPPLRTSSSPVSSNGNGTRLDQTEGIYTRPLVAQQQRQGVSQTARQPVQQYEQRMQPPVRPVQQRSVTPVPLSQPQLPPAYPLRQTPPASMPVSPVAPSKSDSRKHLALVFVMLLILLLGGGIASNTIFQPFAVPEITKTTRTFQNSGLGVSLQYPQKWTVEVHIQSGIAYFYDDNHTDQVNITAAATGGQSINQYLSKTAGSLGMTGQKAAAGLSFAGALWQLVQGSIQQDGASYTATLLVTMHSERYYAILQLAPSSTYTLEDQLVFSKMRSSFQFI
jgi:hypothetical protein